MASDADPGAQVKTLLHALIYSSKLVRMLLAFAASRSNPEMLKDATTSQVSEDEKPLWSALLVLDDRNPESGF